jgi:hypothetical protein
MYKHITKDISASCLFTASKLEDNSKKLKHLVSAAARKATKSQKGPEEGTKEFQKWADTILYFEEELLVQLCFDLDIKHPYDHAIKLLDTIQAPQEVKQLTWTVINDSFKTNVCLKYSMDNIVLAAILMAYRLMNQEPDLRLIGTNPALLDTMMGILNLIRYLQRNYEFV